MPSYDVPDGMINSFASAMPTNLVDRRISKDPGYTLTYIKNINYLGLA